MPPYKLANFLKVCSHLHSVQIAHLSMFQGMILGIFLWICGNTCVRVSMLLLYIGIFPARGFRITCYVVLTLNVAYFISVILATGLICHPFAFNWDPAIPGGFCGNKVHFYAFMGIYNLISDVAVVVLPMPMLWSLQMPNSKKIALSGIFGMGIWCEWPGSVQRLTLS